MNEINANSSLFCNFSLVLMHLSPVHSPWFFSSVVSVNLSTTSDTFPKFTNNSFCSFFQFYSIFRIYSFILESVKSRISTVIVINRQLDTLHYMTFAITHISIIICLDVWACLRAKSICLYSRIICISELMMLWVTVHSIF